MRIGERRGLLLAGGAGLAAAVALVVRDPHGSGSYGVCPSTLLGISCPGCGSLRSLHDALTGDLGAALGHNLLTLPAVIWLTCWWVSRVTSAYGWARLPAPPQSSRFALGVLVVLVVFTVVRNLPGSPLAP